MASSHRLHRQPRRLAEAGELRQLEWSIGNAPGNRSKASPKACIFRYKPANVSRVPRKHLRTIRTESNGNVTAIRLSCRLYDPSRLQRVGAWHGTDDIYHSIPYLRTGSKWPDIRVDFCLYGFNMPDEAESRTDYCSMPEAAEVRASETNLTKTSGEVRIRPIRQGRASRRKTRPSGAGSTYNPVYRSSLVIVDHMSLHC